MIDVQKLLDPVKPSAPCGENLCYDQAFLDLQARARGKEETQFAVAEDPNWTELLSASLELTERFKHLQVGVILALALLQVEGFAGFRDGLKVLQGWIAQFWETVYPQLDPEDNLDPTERMNILQCLSVTGMGDHFRFCDRLAQAAICESRTLGQFNLDKIVASAKGEGGGGDPAQVSAAFRDSSAEVLQARHQALAESLALLDEIDQALIKQVGAGRTPNFEALRKRLTDIRNVMSPHVAAPPNGDKAVPAISGSDSGGKSESAPSGSPQAIKSRTDVLAALQAVCDYYQVREPSSPVPFLLQRAQRLVNMDFLQIMNDLAPESLAQMKAITGAPEVKLDKT